MIGMLRRGTRKERLRREGSGEEEVKEKAKGRGGGEVRRRAVRKRETA